MGAHQDDGSWWCNRRDQQYATCDLPWGILQLDILVDHTVEVATK